MKEKRPRFTDLGSPPTSITRGMPYELAMNIYRGLHVVPWRSPPTVLTKKANDP